MKSCQYCHRSIAGFRLVLTRHNIGGQCVSALSAPRPQGIISVWRHHPVAVCSGHYEHLPSHVNHWQNRTLNLIQERENRRGGPPPLGVFSPDWGKDYCL